MHAAQVDNYGPKICPGSAATSATTSAASSGVGTGAIVGIVVGVCAALAAVGGILWIMKRRRRSKERLRHQLLRRHSRHSQGAKVCKTFIIIIYLVGLRVA